MLGIFVDIENELDDLAVEAKLLSEAADLYVTREQQEGAVWRWAYVQGSGSGVEKIYTGCERIMEMIASQIDGAKINQSC